MTNSLRSVCPSICISGCLLSLFLSTHTHTHTHTEAHKERDFPWVRMGLCPNRLIVNLKILYVENGFNTSDLLNNIINYQGFPDSSVGKESAWNAGDPSLIPGSGRSPGEGIGYPLQYYWASLVAQPVKNPPTVWETWVWSPGWEDPPEKGKATHSNILAWRIPWTVYSMGLQRLSFSHSWGSRLCIKSRILLEWETMEVGTR